MSDAAPTISLRPAVPEDQPLLYRVYAGTRAAEMAQVDWTPEQKEAFVRMQFTAQDSYYREHYVNAAFLIVLADGVPVGRLYVARWPDQIRIMDVALLPEYCNRGIGSRLLRDLQAEAREAGKPLHLHVEQFNPALRLYARLGFRPIAERGVYFELEWSPEEQATG
ncbi:MAG TPA: GNAT family N-acetyltransferase [Chloroflexota bacterium]